VGTGASVRSRPAGSAGESGHVGDRSSLSTGSEGDGAPYTYRPLNAGARGTARWNLKDSRTTRTMSMPASFKPRPVGAGRQRPRQPPAESTASRAGGGLWRPWRGLWQLGSPLRAGRRGLWHWLHHARGRFQKTFTSAKPLFKKPSLRRDLSSWCQNSHNVPGDWNLAHLIYYPFQAEHALSHTPTSLV
jgi:hypothetical protein